MMLITGFAAGVLVLQRPQQHADQRICARHDIAASIAKAKPDVYSRVAVVVVADWLPTKTVFMEGARVNILTTNVPLQLSSRPDSAVLAS
jgi:hypothetical protein